MSDKSPPTLLKLAMQSLLSDETLANSAVNILPTELFPPLFIDAFTARRTNVLKVMVVAWPFPCLPVGALMNTPNTQTLQALLDGLDMLIAQKVHLGRCKLQVVDLRNVHHDFWNIWAGREGGGCSPEVRKKQRVEDFPGSSQRRHLKVLVDLSLRFFLNQYQEYFLQWAEERKSCLKLCCTKMQICSLPIHTISWVLKICQPESIEEFEFSTGRILLNVAHLAVHLGQLRNLWKLSLAWIFNDSFRDVDRYTVMEEKCVSMFISQFSKLVHLQHLYMNEVYFAHGHIQQLLRCLRTPLQTLCITHCHISLSDLNHLAQCQIISQLKHLDLSCAELFNLSPRPLQVLLERVASTLQTLDLNDCMMKDFQLRALLPALSQCTQLTQVNFFDNGFSMASLKDLFYHMASLSQLSLELYPAPRECYDDMGDVLLDRFDQHCSELMSSLRDIRQPKVVFFASDICIECCTRCIFDLETRPCVCWQ